MRREAATGEVGDDVGVKLTELKFRHVFEFFFRDNKHFLLLSFRPRPIAGLMRQTGRGVRLGALDVTKWRSPLGLASVKGEPLQGCRVKERVDGQKNRRETSAKKENEKMRI